MRKMKKTKNRRLNFDVILYIAHLSIFITIYTFNTYGVGNQQRNHQGHRRCFRQYAEDSVLSPRSSYDFIDLAAMYIGDDGFNRVNVAVRIGRGRTYEQHRVGINQVLHRG